jgi:DNA-nicking Smr family endonuclease
MLSHIGLMRDPRARKDRVPYEVWAKMPPDPEILALEAERAQLKGGQYRITGAENEERIRELTKLIAKKRAKRAKDIQREYREDYFHNRPTWEIEGQANGEEEQEYVEPGVAHTGACRARRDPVQPAGRLELHGAPCTPHSSRRAHVHPV